MESNDRGEIKLANEFAYENSLERRKGRQLSFIAQFFYAVVLTDTIRLISTATGITAIGNVVELLRNIIYIVVFIGYYYNSGKREKTAGIIMMFFYVFLLLLSLLLNSGLQVYSITLTLLFISRFLLAFVMIRSLEYPQQLIRRVFHLSWIIPVYVLLYVISPKDLSTGYAYSITFSYNLLLPAIAAFYSFYVLKEKRIYALTISLIAFCGMLVYGSRGTVVCIAVGVIYILFFNRSNYTARKFFVILGLVVIIFSLMIAKDSLLSTLIYLLPNSRSLYLLQNSNFLWDSNRTNYFVMAREYIQSSPLKVTGLAGDTFIYGNQFGMGVELGRHSHNMFVELIVSYGVLLGGVACVYIAYKIIASLFRAKKSPEMRDLCALIVIPLIPYILISGSLCQSYQHWLILGGYSAFIINKYLQDTNSVATYKKGYRRERLVAYRFQNRRYIPCLVF